MNACKNGTACCLKKRLSETPYLLSRLTFDLARVFFFSRNVVFQLRMESSFIRSQRTLVLRK